MGLKLNGLRLVTSLLAVMTMAMPAMADSLLGVAPLRVMLTDTRTNEVISLTNRSSKQRSYKVTLQDQVMNGTGTVSLAEDFPYSAKRMLRFMPRQVTLEPGQHQTIRVMVTPPDQLAEGEYHTHLIFDEVMPVKKNEPGPDNGLKIELENNYSLGIPLIYRHGKVQGSIAVTGASIKTGKGSRPEFLVNMVRTGNGEGNGLLKVVERGGNGESLTLPRNTHLYREVDKVQLSLPLRSTNKLTLQELQIKKLDVVLEREGEKPQVVGVTK